MKSLAILLKEDEHSLFGEMLFMLSKNIFISPLTDDALRLLGAMVFALLKNVLLLGLFACSHLGEMLFGLRKDCSYISFITAMNVAYLHIL